MKDSAVVMRRTPGVTPFVARLDETSTGASRESPGTNVADPTNSGDETRVNFEEESPGNSSNLTSGKTTSSTPTNTAVTPREAAINLANCIMGAGALSLPAFFKSCGAVLGVGLLLASCAWTWCSAVMMVKAADVVSMRVLRGTPVSSYEELMDLTLGRNGRWLSTIGILLLQIGCLVGYANILADVVSPFAIDVLPPGLEPNRAAVLTTVSLGAMLPIGIAVGGDGGSQSLAAVSKASIVIVGIFACVLTWCGMVKSIEVGASEHLVGGVISGAGVGGLSDGTAGALSHAQHANSLTLVNFGGAMSVLPLAIFAFGAHPAILPVTRAMQPSGLKPSINVITIVLRLCAVGYLMIGLGGYSSFRKHTAGNILRNTDGQMLGSFGSKLLKFGYGLVILASVPTILLPLQKSAKDAYLALLPLIVPPVRSGGGMVGTPVKPNTSGGDDTSVPPEVANRLATVVAVVSMTAALCLSLYVPNVAFAFGLTGSTCSFLIAFVLPAASFLSVTSGGGANKVMTMSTKKKQHAIEMNARSNGGSPDWFVINGGGVVNGVTDNSLIHRSNSGNHIHNSANNSGKTYHWFGGEDPDSDNREDDVLFFDDEIEGRTSGLFETEEGVLSVFQKGVERSTTRSSMEREGSHPVSPKKRAGVSKHASMRRWRLGAKVQIIVATVLSVICTREVIRELMHENALVTVVSKMADAKLSAEKIEQESTQISMAKEKFEKSSVELDHSVKDAEKALHVVHEHRDEETSSKQASSDSKKDTSVSTAEDGLTSNLTSDIDEITATLESRLQDAIHLVNDEDIGEGGDGEDGERTASVREKNHKRHPDTSKSAETSGEHSSKAKHRENDEEATELDLADQETLGKLESSLISTSASDSENEKLAETVFVAKESLEKVKKVEAAASNTTAAKFELEEALKHSDEVKPGDGHSARGKALDEGVQEKTDDDDLDAEQMDLDAEARKAAHKKRKDGGKETETESSDKLSDPSVRVVDGSSSESSSTPANASAVVQAADVKIEELKDAKAKVELEAEAALEVAVTAEGVDEVLAKDLVSALANLTGT